MIRPNAKKPAQRASVPQSYKPEQLQLLRREGSRRPGVESRSTRSRRTSRSPDKQSVRHGEQAGHDGVLPERPAINPLAPVLSRRFQPLRGDLPGEPQRSTTIWATAATDRHRGLQTARVQSTNHISSVPDPGHRPGQAVRAPATRNSTGTQPPERTQPLVACSPRSPSSSSQQPVLPPRNGNPVRPVPERRPAGPTNEGHQTRAPTPDGNGRRQAVRTRFRDERRTSTGCLNSRAAATGRTRPTASFEVLPARTVRARRSRKSCNYKRVTPATTRAFSDTTVANDYLNFVNTNGPAGLQTTSELFKRPPGHPYQDIPNQRTRRRNQIVPVDHGQRGVQETTR